MPTLKIVIPMAGRGKRLGDLTGHRPKALVRLANGRLLDHVLNSFTELERDHLLEYVFIVGFLGERIKDYMQEHHPDKKVLYFWQDQLIGQSHAVIGAKEAIDGPILLTFCDTINTANFASLSDETLDGVAFVQEVEDPRRHGVAITGPDHLITNLIEKPQTSEFRSALTGLYYFREGKDLVQAIEKQLQTGRSQNGEYYLADAINIMISNGKRMRAERTLQWLDAGTPEALLDTNAHLLRRLPETNQGAAHSQKNILIPPVYIHESARVSDCILGPNVAIGKNCSINKSILENTIIDDDSKIATVHLNHSLIGEGSSVTGSAFQTMVGDHDSVDVAWKNDDI